jgi:hypothetical protein
MSDDPNQDQPTNPPGEPGEPYPPQPPSEPSAPAGYSQPPYSQPEANPYPAPPAYPGQGYQGYQGYPPPGGPYGAYAPPASQGFNFQALLQRWQNVLTRPSVPTFDAEQPAANWQTILISLVILGVVAAVAQFIGSLEIRGVTTLPIPGSAGVPIHANPIRDAFGGLIGAFIGFFVISGILYVSAKIFGGQGSFLSQSWLLSLFYVPLNLITAVAGLIPFVGGIVAFAAFVYSVYLAVLAIASAHRMPTGRATAAVLLPLAIVFVVACALIVALAALIVTLMRNFG